MTPYGNGVKVNWISVDHPVMKMCTKYHQCISNSL